MRGAGGVAPIASERGLERPRRHGRAEESPEGGNANSKTALRPGGWPAASIGESVAGARWLRVAGSGRQGSRPSRERLEAQVGTRTYGPRILLLPRAGTFAENARGVRVGRQVGWMWCGCPRAAGHRASPAPTQPPGGDVGDPEGRVVAAVGRPAGAAEGLGRGN